MLPSPLDLLAARGKTLVALLVLVLVLAAAVPVGAQAPPATAWQALMAERPEADDHTSISTLERRILQVLTPAQATAYAAGEDPEALVLANGETLASFLDRQRRLEASGLLYKPIVPCRVLDSRRIGPPLAVEEKLQLHLRGPATDYSRQGGENSGCGLPGLRGEVLRTNSARALMLSVETHDAAGLGSVELWPAGGARRPGIGLVSFGLGTGSRQMLVVAVCDEESVHPCQNGDLALALHGAAAHVVADVLGYFEPPWTAFAQEPKEHGPDDETPAALKSTGLWQQSGDDIYYTAGRVAIGTDTPEWTLSIAEALHARILLRSDDDGLSNEVGIGFSNLDGTEFFQIGLDDDGENAFHIGPKHLTSKYLTILSDGKVGINTKTPDMPLTIYGTAHLRSNNPNLRLTDKSVGETDPGYSWNVRNQNSAFKIYEGTRLNSPAFFIRSDGNVGIHTTQPDEVFQVEGNFKLSGNIVPIGDLCIGNCS
ncbi:MAG: hypothetical protein GY842_17325 [bacterium]|nr:hypothetical protein [bacterium]